MRTTGGVIDGYVTELGRVLTGPRGPKLDLVAEARDNLLDAAEALECDGLGRDEAERAAVEEFGAIDEVAPGFQEELSVLAGRRLAGLLFVSVPLVTLMWSLIWRIFPTGPAVYATWPGWFLPVSRSLDALQFLVGALGGAALFALGRGLRRIHRPRRVVRSLALLVWCTLPVRVALSLALIHGSHGPPGFYAYLPGIAAALVTHGVTFAHLYCAARCLGVTRRPPAPA
ncbi:hypothetical protein GCM10017673_20250 [Streptosporangium violaceochromogenes]|nr:hypothetical protein GCM10017673_20250 [Streptosporangium violaceochromogenes]